MIRYRTLNEWSKIFGVILEDTDGFPRILGNTWGVLISLEEFIQGSAGCSLGYENLERYKVLDDLQLG